MLTAVSIAISTVVIAGLATTVFAHAQTAPGMIRPVSPPVLADHGYFFVGGQYVENGGRKLMAGQMYAPSLLMMQFATPSNLEASAVIGVITTAIVIIVALLARRFGLQDMTQR